MVWVTNGSVYSAWVDDKSRAVMCARKEDRFNKCTGEREFDYQR